MKTNNNIIEEQEVTPIFFNITNEKEELDMQKLLCENPHIKIFDAIQSQLKELVRSLYPNKYPNKKYTAEQIQQGIQEHIKDIPIHKYGVWVYYPWSSRLVHILDEKEFIDLRTNRNMYKITKDERNILATKKIGIIGLSVGQSIALTLAMERGCGELRLADFDVLELSNLNRIRSGVHNIGLKKVIMAAREIAEIDPYLKVICFEDGVTEANMDNFFLEGGKLDILVDECDGLDIKILCRQRARQLGIPVIMDTSDRGLFDVERFDIEPDRPILHGLIENIDPQKIKTLSDEEKIPYILPMIGSEKLSIRMKASMVEVEQSITTWPQLASAVVLGGALGADVCRRILLNQFYESGRYYVDMEEQIGNHKIDMQNQYAKEESFYSPPELTMEVLKKIIYKYIPTGSSINIDSKMLAQIIEAAIHTPSGGNAQPWKFVYYNDKLFIFHDPHFSHSLLDYKNLGSHLAFGAMLQNIEIRAAFLSLELTIDSFPLKDEPNLIAVVLFSNSTIQKNSLLHLNDTIIKRVTNRNVKERKLLNEKDKEALKNLASTISGAKLDIFDKYEELEIFADILPNTERIRFMHKRGHYDTFIKELRFTKEEVISTMDGLDIDTLSMTASDKAGLTIAKDYNAIKLLNKLGRGERFKKLSSESIKTASAIGLLSMNGHEASHFFNGGKAVQNVWLEANYRGISFQPISQIVFMLERYQEKGKIDFNPFEQSELEDIRQKFMRLINLDKNRYPIFVFRFCYSNYPKIRALRKPIEKVLFTF